MSTLPLAVSSATENPGLDVSAAMWAGLALLLVALVVVDLLVFARRHVPTLRESALWSLAWLALALLFGAAWWWWQGAEAGSQYFAGYLLERSLSLDNIFVFAVILAYFGVPERAQPRVLAWGVALALVLRLVFILLGAALLDAFDATFYLFGALLLYTAYKLARHDGSSVRPEHNPALRLLRRAVPITPDFEGERLVVRRASRFAATPLLAVFLVVATTDLIFAVDSIPAIFAVTREPFIVFAANAFALLGMRALYFVLAGMAGRFVYLSHGLSAILAFIGVKMLVADVWHPPVWASLAVIVVVLAVAVVVSLWAAPRSRRTVA